MVSKKIVTLMVLVVLLVAVGVVVPRLLHKESAVNLAPACTATDQDIDTLQKKINKTSEQGGGIVTMKPCLYPLTEPLVVKSNIHLAGKGEGKTVIEIKAKTKDGKANTNKAIRVEEGSANVAISDLTIDGNKANRKELVNADAHTLEISRVDGFKVNKVEIVNSVSASIILFNSRNGVIQNCKISRSGSNGILALRQVDQVKVIDNVIDHTDEQNGIFFSYQEGLSSSNIVIEGNTVKQAADFGIEVGHIVPEGDPQHQNIMVRNNKVLNSTNAGIAFRTVSNGIIENNEVSGYGKNGSYGGDGIFVEGGFNVSSNVEVLDNTIKQVFKTGGANAVYVTGIDGALIRGNKVSDSRGRGLFVQASALPDNKVTAQFPEGNRLFNRISVIGNEFLDNAMDGIHFQGYDSQNNVVKDNRVEGNGLFGIEIANMTQGNRFLIENNQVSGNGKQGLMIYQETYPQIAGNHFKNNNKKSEKVSAAVSLSSTENAAVRDNTYEDNQKKTTQLYDVDVENSSGVVNVENRYEGGTKKQQLN